MIKLVTVILYIIVTPCYTQAPEPFKDLHSYSIDNPPRPWSPDPLVRYTWSSDTNVSELQIYRVDRPNKYTVDPPSAMAGVESLLLNHTKEPLNIVVSGAGTLRLDWGTERAAWLEFQSPDLHTVDNANVTASISEYNSPFPDKTRPVTRYGTCTYRLETNDELYEGVRFTWIHFSNPSKPWHITSLSLVAKVKPVNYTGSFVSSDDTLSVTWYTGAYGVRLNMESDAFNSILMERGDRVSIQGDGHPTMAASLVAFAPYELVHDMIVQTNSGFVHGHHVVDDTIMPYPIYWTMTINDWFMACGNTRGFLRLAPDAMSIIDKRVNDFLDNPNLVWMGWDDRIGDGWCSPGSLLEGGCGREAHLTFAALVVRACRDLGRSLRLAGMHQDGRRYQNTAQRLGRVLRQVPDWPNGFGLHSAANVMNAGSLVANSTEIDMLFDLYLNDSVHVCSLSNFNQYWILQGLGNANKMEHALASIKLCWGTKLCLGKGCLWEMFSPYWAAWMEDGDKAPIGVSYCHPWSSGVTAWLSQAVGGIQALLPGYKEFVVAPYVSSNYPKIKAQVPTPFGKIVVSAQLDGNNNHADNAKVTIAVEAATTGFIGIRRHIAGQQVESAGCLLDASSVLLNDKPVVVAPLEDIAASVSSLSDMALTEHFVPTVASELLFLRQPSGGAYTVSAMYFGDCEPLGASTPPSTSTERAATAVSSSAGIPHFPPFPVPKYPAESFLDRVSQGDGISKYGRDGYVLFGFNNGVDLKQLPKYIKNFTVHRHDYNGWASIPRSFVGRSGNDTSYLPDPRPSHRGERALGFLGEDLVTVFGRGVIVDVDIDKDLMEGPFQLAVYCVAHDSTEKHAMRAQDKTTMNLIAPTLLMSNYTQGVWWGLRYDRSIRIRLMGIQASRASAVAFGTPNGIIDQDTMKAEATY